MKTKKWYSTNIKPDRTDNLIIMTDMGYIFEAVYENGKFLVSNNDQVSYIAWSEHIATCGKILSFLDTLEVKEVDLEEVHYKPLDEDFERDKENKVMTKEEKELLLKYLCMALPYDVMVDYESHINILNEIDPACKDIDYITVRIQDVNSTGVERLMCATNVMIESIKPYLRPMSSMTEDEEKKFNELKLSYYFDEDSYILLDWLNEHHFDYRGLIEKGLAIEAPKGMYNN